MEKNVYKKDAYYARENNELPLYRESKQLNMDCSAAIGRAIKDCNCDTYRYDMKAAIVTVVEEYGVDRVSWVLATTLQKMDYDGRFSYENKSWGKSFSVPDVNDSYCAVETHPAVLDGFISSFRNYLLVS